MSADIAQMLLTAGIGSAATMGAGLIAKALGFWNDSGVSKAEMELRLKQMKEEIERSNRDWEKDSTGIDAKIQKTMGEHQALLLVVTELQAKQNITNQVVIDGMKSLTAKMEQHDARFSSIDHQTREFQTTQNMIRQLLDEIRSQRREAKER